MHQIRVPMPKIEGADILATPDGTSPEYLAGAPTAIKSADFQYLAFLLQSPQGPRRKGAIELAKSSDGVAFETISRFSAQAFSAQAIGRPRLVCSADGLWRLYVECTRKDGAVRILVMEATAPELFDPKTAMAVTYRARPEFLGNGSLTDMVIRQIDGIWHTWLSVGDVGIVHGTSYDGVEWTLDSVALPIDASAWFEAGMRPASVLAIGGQYLLYFDGVSKAGDYRTGIAIGASLTKFRSVGKSFLTSAVVSASDEVDLRASATDERERQDADVVVPIAFSAIDVVSESDGMWRMYYECARPSGARELRTELVQGIDNVVLDLTRKTRAVRR